MITWNVGNGVTKWHSYWSNYTLAHPFWEITLAVQENFKRKLAIYLKFQVLDQ